MNRISLAVLTLALSVGVMSGCSEKKQPEKATEAVAPAPASVAETPAVKEAAPVAAVENKEPAAKVVVKPVEVKKPAVPAASGVPMKLAAEQKVQSAEQKVQATVDTAQKTAAEKAAAPVGAVETAVTAAESKVQTTVAAATADVQAGALIYKSKCLPCHGADGKGTAMAPAFKGNSWIKGASNGDITDVIKNGRAGKAKKDKNFFVDMPYNKGLSEKDLNDLVGYLRSIN
jgi:mono/diheme cytochrome c family protein